MAAPRDLSQLETTVTRRRPGRSGGGAARLVLRVVWSGDRVVGDAVFDPAPGAAAEPVGRAFPLGAPDRPAADPYLSRHHFDVWRDDDDGLQVRNLSGAGLFHDGVAADEGPVALAAGDVLRAGDTLFVAHAAPLDEREDGLPRRIVGVGRTAGTLRDAVRLYASADFPALVLGESGTGKELVAQALHDLSPRKARPFLPINCANLTPPLADSELFGHERGAFTGADRRKAGVFERSRGGTVFLDEVGELPAEVQAKLLRVLEEGVFVRVGGEEALRTEARVVAATNRDLAEMAGTGAFRVDLLERLQVLRVLVPPLRDRPEDVPAIAAHVLAELAGGRAPGLVADDVERLLCGRWPRNVRELANVLTRAFVHAQGASVVALDAEDRASLEGESRWADAAVVGAPGEEEGAGTFADWLVLARHMAAHDWQPTRAMAAAGRPRNYFYRQLARFGVESGEALRARFEALPCDDP